MYNILNQYDDSSKYDKVFFVSESLQIETYIVGYKSQGESVLFFILVDGIVCFSGVVDCYCVEGVNYTETILKNKGVTTLNFLCWTHPDIDHSRGIDHLVDNFANKNTKIWIPEDVDISKATCGDKLKSFFCILKDKVLNDKYTVHSVSDNKNLMYYESYCFKYGTNVYPLEIGSYAPNSAIVKMLNYKDRFNSNLYSVFLEVLIKDTNIMLTGDTMDATIEQIPKRCLNKHVHILKIPHHGSDTSCKLYRELNKQKIDVSCATVYRLGKAVLPKDEVMRVYKDKSSFVYCTGRRDCKNENDNYGIVKISTDVLTNKYCIDKYGNAELWE